MSCSLSCRAIDITSTTDRHKIMEIITVTVTLNGIINKCDSSTTKQSLIHNMKRNNTMIDDTIPAQQNTIVDSHTTQNNTIYTRINQSTTVHQVISEHS